MPILTQDRVKELFDYDPETGIVTRKVTRGCSGAGSVVGTLHNAAEGYLSVKIDKKSYLLHRVIWFYVYGYMPEGKIDHKNGDTICNRLANLREVTNSQTAWNGKQRENETGVKGVRLTRSGTFQARICVGYKSICVGSFSSLKETQVARETATLAHHGEFARMK